MNIPAILEFTWHALATWNQCRTMYGIEHSLHQGFSTDAHVLMRSQSPLSFVLSPSAYILLPCNRSSFHLPQANSQTFHINYSEQDGLPQESSLELGLHASPLRRDWPLQFNSWTKCQQMILLLHHLHAQTPLGLALEALIRTYQLWAGIHNHVLSDTQSCPWVPSQWLSFLQQSMHTNQIQITYQSWTLPALSKNPLPNGGLQWSKLLANSIRMVKCLLHVSPSYYTVQAHQSYWTGTHAADPFAQTKWTTKGSAEHQFFHFMLATSPLPFHLILAFLDLDHM